MSRPFHVSIADFVNDSLEPERNELADLANVTAIGAQCEKDLVGKIEHADAVMVYHLIRLSDESIARLNGCRLIVRCGVGVDNVDLSAARKKGIPVANIPDYGTEEVADTAIGMTLSLVRGTHYLNSRVQLAGGPWDYTQAVPLRRIRGQTFGIIGLGRIGTAVAIRAKCLGFDVVYFDPYKQDGYDKALGIRRASTAGELLSQSYVTSLHCPLNDDTYEMINARTLSQMPPGSYLVNTARGAVVDTLALLDSIESGHLAGAALDVLPTEPPNDHDALILAWRDVTHAAHSRLIINPHAAFYSEQGLLDMRTKGAQACRMALLEQTIPNVVN